MNAVPVPTSSRRTAIGPIRHLVGRALDCLYPPRCVVPGCSARGAWICLKCLQSVTPIRQPCPRCALPTTDSTCVPCKLEPPAFVRCSCAGVYVGVLPAAVRALKYRAVGPVAEPLGQLIADAYRAHGPVPTRLLVVAVPTHRHRVRERGVDHARLLARYVASCLERPFADGLVERVRVTAPQYDLTEAERRINVAGAFAAGAVSQAPVLIVDDVVTTGATLRAAAAALLEAGASEVHAAAVARAVSAVAAPRRRPL